MRVLFVTGEYPPMQGGVGDYTWALGMALSQEGVDVHVLTSTLAGPAHLAPQGVTNLYPEIARWRWSLSGHVRRLAREIEPDVLHVQYQAAAYGLHPAINLLPRALRGEPWPRSLAVTFHDLRVPYLFPKAGPLRWQANLALAGGCAAAITTNAEDSARLRAAGPKLAGKLREIPIGSNISPEPPQDFDRDSQRARWGAGPGDLLLAYFGFLNASKGGEELIEATALMAREGAPVRLLMIGGQTGASDPTNAAYLARVRDLIQSLGIGDLVHWTGFTDSSEVSANLLAADAALLPYRDGASFRRGSLMACLAHGLPVISTEPTVAVRELSHGENIWLVPHRDAQALAEAAGKVLQDVGLRRRLGAGARELSTRFTWDSIARQHIEVYRELAGQR